MTSRTDDRGSVGGTLLCGFIHLAFFDMAIPGLGDEANEMDEEGWLGS